MTDTIALETELIQVAAVAVAIVTDLRYGGTDVPPERTQHILELVGDERYRQDMKWENQHHDPVTWLAILAEEVGEVSEELPDPDDNILDMMMGSIERAGRTARRYLGKKFAHIK